MKMNNDVNEDDLDAEFDELDNQYFQESL